MVQAGSARARAKLRLFAGAATAALGVVLALFPAGAASAHDYLVTSDPADGSIITTSLSQVTLTFNEAVLDFADSTRLQVTGPDTAEGHAETACATVADTIVSAPVTLSEPGEYTVVWRIVSADGHAVSDTFAFRYEPADASSVTSAAGAVSGSSSGPSCGGDIAAAPNPTSPRQDNYLLVGTAVVIAVVAVVTFGIILLRRPRDPDEF